MQKFLERALRLVFEIVVPSLLLLLSLLFILGVVQFIVVVIGGR